MVVRTATWFRGRWWENLGTTHTVAAFDPRQWQLFLPAELRAILLSKMTAGVYRITEYTHSRFAWGWLGEICETFYRRMVDSALSVGMPDLPNHKCQHRKRSNHHDLAHMFMVNLITVTSHGIDLNVTPLWTPHLS